MLIRLGTDYGGWTIPDGLLNHGSICYCVGVGEDTSFDLALIEKYQCEVYAFDPTPRAQAYVRANAENSRYHFLPLGVWDRDATVPFFRPRDAVHVSHSVTNLQRSDVGFYARVQPLGTIMQGLGHTRLDLLKLDIEGAEYGVIESIIKNQIPVGILCVEFHGPVETTGLLDAGFEIVFADERHVTCCYAGFFVGPREET